MQRVEGNVDIRDVQGNFSVKEIHGNLQIFDVDGSQCLRSRQCQLESRSLSGENYIISAHGNIDCNVPEDASLDAGDHQSCADHDQASRCAKW